jgi:hypothetical protein
VAERIKAAVGSELLAAQVYIYVVWVLMPFSYAICHMPYYVIVF